MPGFYNYTSACLVIRVTVQEKWLIMAPSHSMNDGIDSDLCSLSYSIIEHVAGMATIYPTEAYSPRLTLSGQMHYVPLCYGRAIIQNISGIDSCPTCEGEPLSGKLLFFVEYSW